MDGRYIADFHQYLVVNKSAVDSPDVQQLIERVQDVLGSDRYKCILIPSSRAIREALVRPQHKDGLVRTLEGLEIAFCTLMAYGVNLIRHGDKREYHTIKTYTGYYVCNIRDNVGLFGDDVLKSMGYRYREEFLKDELVLAQLSELIFDLTFELFLSIAETRKVTLIARHIASNGYSDEVAARVFQNVDRKEFKLSEVLDYCELIQRELSRSVPTSKLREQTGYSPYMYETFSEPLSVRNHSGPPSLMFDQTHAGIEDRDLYGGGKETGAKHFARNENNLAAGSLYSGAFSEPRENSFEEVFGHTRPEVRFPPSWTGKVAATESAYRFSNGKDRLPLESGTSNDFKSRDSPAAVAIRMGDSPKSQSGFQFLNDGRSPLLSGEQSLQGKSSSWFEMRLLNEGDCEKRLSGDISASSSITGGQCRYEGVQVPVPKLYEN